LIDLRFVAAGRDDAEAILTEASDVIVRLAHA
jgi:hypothetical protein